QIALKTAPLAAPVSSHGRTINEGVAEIAWTGGRLDDAHFDEFVLRAALPETPGAVLAFKIVQECESGTHRWIDVAAPGQPEPKEPAPQLRLTPRP
ncbi:MAG TPA: YcnI family protein, partial [Alphaproteobacteria bacterium]|nr:YcnI family protein [Alphaproteobacteria bacterium]